MSQISSRENATSNASHNHWIAERIFDESGIPVTHLRPTFFAEWLLYAARTVKTQDAIILPFGETPYAPITGEDQGRVIASILANPEPHAGKIYELFGLEEMTQHKVAEVVSEVVGRQIVYRPVEIADFEPILRNAMRANDYFTQHILSVAQDCRDGIFSGTNTNIEDITGQKAMSMKEFIIKNKAALV